MVGSFMLSNGNGGKDGNESWLVMLVMLITTDGW